MARDFDSTHYAVNSDASIDTETHVTFCIRVKFDTTTPASDGYIMSMPESTGSNGCDFRHESGDGVVYFDCVTDGGSNFTTGVAAPDTTAWHTLIGRYDNGNIKMWLDDSTDTGSVSATGGIRNATTSLLITAFSTLGNIQFDGKACEAAVWKSAISDGEADALIAGFSPLFIDRANLYVYYKLNGTGSPEPDELGGFPLTVTAGTAVVDHPGVIYPAPAASVLAVEAAAPASGIAPKWHHLRNLHAA